MQNNRPESKTEQIYRYRTLLIDKVIANDTASIRDLYQTLVNDYENEYYIALYPYEKRIINLILKDYAAFVKGIVSTNDESIRKVKEKLQPKEDGLGKMLYNKLVENKDKLSVEVNADNTLTADKKAFILMNIDNYTSPLQGARYQDKVNADATVFLNSYPESNLTSYVRNYMRYEYKPKGFLFGYELSLGTTIMSPHIRNYLGTGGGLGLGILWGYKNWQFNTRLFMSFSKTHENLYYKGILWPANSGTDLFLPELSLGYAFRLSKKMNLTPLVGVGWLTAMPNDNVTRKYPDLNNAEISTKTSPLFGIDFGWGISEGYTYNEVKRKYSYIFSSFNLRYTYQNNRFTKQHQEMDGLTHTITISVKIGGGKAKRVF
ncbi:MAG: hypothetical protein Q8909_03855 [Bacteroidota bacterium]|nr:hypothetical protein [Bacteroidota bacterium]